MNFKSNYQKNAPVKFIQVNETSRTRQSEADGCDVNKIMERFNRTGKIPTLQQLPARYGDARVVDFQTAQTIVKDAKEQFLTLPAKTRKAFGNDPQAFLQALSDPNEETTEQLKKLGILVPRKPTPEEVLEQIAANTKPAENAAV